MKVDGRTPEYPEVIRATSKWIMALGYWFGEHQKVIGVLHILMAILNGRIAFEIFADHPLMAFANTSMAAALVWMAVLSWRMGGNR